MLRLSSAAVLALLVCASPVRTQDDWDLRFPLPGGSPPPDSNGPMAYDEARGKVVYLHRINSSQIETWEWDGSTWTLAPASAPSAGPIFYDSNRQRVVQVSLITSATPPVLMLHKWDGALWTQISNTRPNFITSINGVVYDEARNRVVLVHSGSNGIVEVAEFDGSVWNQVPTVVSPPNRRIFELAYYPPAQVVALYGGTSINQTVYLRDLWFWDGAIWREKTTSSVPNAYANGGLVFDKQRGSLILFGGTITRPPNGLNFCNETWEYVNGNWRQLHPLNAPARRREGSMAYDSGRDRVVLFGGTNGTPLGDTWELQRGVNATYSTFGTGCAGSMGTPTLEPRAGSVPRIGTAFTAQLKNLPLTGQAFMFLGLSKTQYGALTLPFDLSVIGMTGCTLYSSGDDLFGVTNVLGIGTWSFIVPPIHGLPFYNQGIMLDPAANPLGMTVTNAGEGVIGN